MSPMRAQHAKAASCGVEAPPHGLLILCLLRTSVKQPHRFGRPNDRAELTPNKVVSWVILCRCCGPCCGPPQ